MHLEDEAVIHFFEIGFYMRHFREMQLIFSSIGENVVEQ